MSKLEHHVAIPLQSDSGVRTEQFLPADIVAAARQLPEKAEAYFELTPTSEMIPTSQLVLTRCRSDGVREAVRRMRAAYDGTYSRRAPITVQRLDPNSVLVIDGNSTAAIAIAAGWKFVPVERH